jgi:hypothetical protein
MPQGGISWASQLMNSSCVEQLAQDLAARLHIVLHPRAEPHTMLDCGRGIITTQCLGMLLLDATTQCVKWLVSST